MKTPENPHVIELHWAANCGDLKRVKILLDGPADVNAEFEGGETPLHGAAFGGNSEVVAALLQAGADVNAASPSPTKHQPNQTKPTG